MALDCPRELSVHTRDTVVIRLRIPLPVNCVAGEQLAYLREALPFRWECPLRQPRVVSQTSLRLQLTELEGLMLVVWYVGVVTERRPASSVTGRGVEGLVSQADFAYQLGGCPGASCLLAAEEASGASTPVEGDGWCAGPVMAVTVACQDEAGQGHTPDWAQSLAQSRARWERRRSVSWEEEDVVYDGASSATWSGEESEGGDMDQGTEATEESVEDAEVGEMVQGDEATGPEDEMVECIVDTILEIVVRETDGTTEVAEEGVGGTEEEQPLAEEELATPNDDILANSDAA